MRSISLLSFFAVAAVVANAFIIRDKDFPNDVAILVDSSDALEPEEFNAVLAMLDQFVDDVQPSSGTVRVAFYGYGQKVSPSNGNEWASSAADAHAAIRALPYDGTEFRSLQTAISAAFTILIPTARPYATKTLVVVASDTWTDAGSVDANDAAAGWDRVVVLGFGVQPILNSYQQLLKLERHQSRHIFFCYDSTELPYAGKWLLDQVTQPDQPTDQQPQPTPAPQAVCDTSNLVFDLYIIVDSSSATTQTAFSYARTALSTVVRVLPIGANVQVAVVSVAADPSVYYTTFGTATQRQDAVTAAVDGLAQDIVTAQTLDLTLRTLQTAYDVSGRASTGRRQLVLYVTSTTDFDVDPTASANALNANWLIVRLGTGADHTVLEKLAGGQSCVVDALNPTAQSGLDATIEQLLCYGTTCRF